MSVKMPLQEMTENNWGVWRYIVSVHNHWWALELVTKAEVQSAYNNSSSKAFILKPFYFSLLPMQCFPSCHWFHLTRYNIILLWQNKHPAFFWFLADYSKHNFPFADAVNCTNAHVILFRLRFHPVLTIMQPLCWSPCWQTSAGTVLCLGVW